MSQPISSGESPAARPSAGLARFAVVTGASRGLGEGFAAALAAAGRPLVLAARDGVALQAVAGRLSAEHGVAVVTVQADLGTAEGVRALLAACEGRDIDLLINNAGFGLGQAFADQDPAAIAQMLQLNVLALTELTHGLLPAIVAARGSIVQVASFAGFVPVPYMAAYAASKAYVLHFAEALAEELAGRGVHVMAVCPGAVATAFWQRANINLQNTRMAATSTDVVVAAAMRGLRRRKRLVVPLFGQRLSLFSARFASRQLVTRLAAKLMNRPTG